MNISTLRAVVTFLLVYVGPVKSAGRDLTKQSAHFQNDRFAFVYDWIDGHRLMYESLRNENEPTLAIFYISTRRSRPLARLQGNLKREPLTYGEMGPISPDGKWLLLVSGQFKDPEGWLAITCDGHQTVRKSPGPVYSELLLRTIWRRDSRGWIALSPSSDSSGRESAFHIRIESADIREVKLPKIKREWRWLTNVDYGYGVLNAIGWTSRTNILLAPYNMEFWHPLPLYEVNAESEHDQLTEYSITLPKALRPEEVVLNRQGNQLAWLLYPPARPIAPSDKPATVEIWTSRVNGDSIRHVGEVPVQPFSGFRGHDFPEYLRWLPDGKRLSFVRSESLYIVNVP